MNELVMPSQDQAKVYVRVVNHEEDQIQIYGHWQESHIELYRLGQFPTSHSSLAKQRANIMK